jgi:hypothetical protein
MSFEIKRTIVLFSNRSQLMASNLKKNYKLLPKMMKNVSYG